MRKPWSLALPAGLSHLAVLLAAASAQALVVDVTLSDTAITPDTVMIAPGDTVRWTVVTGVHQLHSDTDSFKSWDSGLLDTPGQTYELPFLYADGVGPFHYHCLLHGRIAAVLVADTCFASGTLNDSGPPTVADMVYVTRVLGGSVPLPDNLYRLDLTGDCLVNSDDAQALSDYFQFGPGTFPVYPVPTCCFPELQLAACAVTVTGDVNDNNSLTSADIIFLIGFVFEGGAEPEPCVAAGDVNCTGSVTSADIIYMVNHIFKSGPLPCDVCSIVPDLWECL